jgi:hypothetical protein
LAFSDRGACSLLQRTLRARLQAERNFFTGEAGKKMILPFSRRARRELCEAFPTSCFSFSDHPSRDRTREKPTNPVSLSQKRKFDPAFLISFVA